MLSINNSNICCKQIVYETKDVEKMFPLDKEEEVKAIVLDSANLNKGKVFESEDDKILNFISEQSKFGDKATYYDYIITKKGTIYQTAPLNKAAHCVTYNLYSEEISKRLPKYCPQTDGNVYPNDKTPDAVAISILIECESDESTNVDNGILSGSAKESLEDLIAYYIQNHKLTVKDVYERFRFPKDSSEVKLAGPSFFKNNITQLIVILSYALAISRNNSELKIVSDTDPIRYVN